MGIPGLVTAEHLRAAQGYAERFGLVSVDYDSFNRRPKDSARWFSDVIGAGGPPSAACANALDMERKQTIGAVAYLPRTGDP